MAPHFCGAGASRAAVSTDTVRKVCDSFRSLQPGSCARAGRTKGDSNGFFERVKILKLLDFKKGSPKISLYVKAMVVLVLEIQSFWGSCLGFYLCAGDSSWNLTSKPRNPVVIPVHVFFGSPICFRRICLFQQCMMQHGQFFGSVSQASPKWILKLVKKAQVTCPFTTCFFNMFHNTS